MTKTVVSQPIKKPTQHVCKDITLERGNNSKMGGNATVFCDASYTRIFYVTNREERLTKTFSWLLDEGPVKIHGKIAAADTTAGLEKALLPAHVYLCRFLS